MWTGEPDRLDLARNDGTHLSFGQGMHHCLGATIARLEGQVVIGSPVARFPNMRLLTPGVRYREHLVLRGLTELRVAV